jgi:hypothetical protein
MLLSKVSNQSRPGSNLPCSQIISLDLSPKTNPHARFPACYKHMSTAQTQATKLGVFNDEDNIMTGPESKAVQIMMSS